MAERFVEVDRNTPMLLPADLRDWVPEDDLVHFVIEAVKTLPSGEFVVNERGTGYAQYPPSMMLALLIYCYANGIFSSRRIERATYRDLGVRFLTGDTHPDHDTICSFRRQNERLIAKLFVRVLELARELKLLQVGTISVDGTRLKANASKHRGVSYQRSGQLIEQLEEEVKGIRLVKHGVDGRDAVFFSRRSWLGSSSPSAGCQFGDAADRQIGETRQDRAEIIADGDLQATAGFDDGEDGCDARTGFSASEVDPVFAT